MSLVTDATAIAFAAIRAVDPAKAVDRLLRTSGRTLWIGRTSVPLCPDAGVAIVGIGKAAGAMVDAALERVGPVGRGIAFVPHGYPGPRSAARAVWGDHPVPSLRSFRAGRQLLDHVRRIEPDEVALFLLSGGGSATVELPVAGLQQTDLHRTTQRLLASGAPIQAMNAIRRHLSALKGGRLALACHARDVATLAISDVVGDAPSDIASGPTVADPTSFRDAWEAVRAYRLAPSLPRRVTKFLSEGARGEHEETPKPGDPGLVRSRFVVAASNRDAVRAARAAAEKRGYRTRDLATPVTGETRAAAERFADAVMRAARRGGDPRPRALVAGGETTVTLGARAGHGGRNTEFALAAALRLRGRTLVLSMGTDGKDGPTDAAGGWVDGSTFSRAEAQGVDVGRALARHSSYDALNALGTLVRTGPTGTNVMDVHVGLAVPSPRGEPASRTAGSSRPRGARTSRRRRS